MLNHDGRKAGSKSWMWSIPFWPSIIKTGRLSCMNTSRQEMHPITGILKGYISICVTDGYQIYHTLEKELEELTIAGCWVTVILRFDEALTDSQTIPKINTFLLMKQIQAIYREEGKLNDLSSDEQLKQRQAVIKPLVDAFCVPENHKCVQKGQIW